jgi:ribonuclease HII
LDTSLGASRIQKTRDLNRSGCNKTAITLMVLLAGVDEAGRGCVIGPLVVAGVLIEERRSSDLVDLGVRDSKQLSPRKRETLAAEIKAVARKWAYFDLQPWAIDKVVERAQKYKKLNYLEAMAMARVIRDLRPDRAYVDPADVVAERYGEQMLKALPWKPELVCEKKADVKYPVVSAASILAKVRRDSIVAELREMHGDFGSGYPSDWRTVEFLESLLGGTDVPPLFVRRSWSTVRRMLREDP